MDKSQIDALWNDKTHWKLGIYHCKEDPRVIVPKKPKWAGWTVNFAHAMAIPMIIVFIAIVFIPIWILNLIGKTSAVWLVGSILFSTVILIIFSTWMASKTK